MALVTTLVIVALGLVLVGSANVPARLQAARMNAELSDLVDGGTAELVRERLRAHPVQVRVHSGRRIHGPFLDIEVGDLHLHFRLYHDTRGPATDERSVTCLTGLQPVDGVGWVATFDGPRGSQRYLGWLVESVA
jgi:hypothetical protein